jgi:DNA-binding NarL/FixJ family response regulator
LKSQIREMKPDIIMMSARYYHCSTPYMMGELHKEFPKPKMAALCIGEYPDELAMYFIVNGIDSYATSFDGFEHFFWALGEISKGRKVVSPGAQTHLDMRNAPPVHADTITGRRTEVIRLTCNGFNEFQIADTLDISRSTVANHKTEIFRSLNVTSTRELLMAALKCEIITEEELCFRPDTYTISPLPDKKIMHKKSA